MKAVKFLVLAILVFGNSQISKAYSLDSSYVYSYSCASCGQFKTVSIEEIPIVTSSSSQAIIEDSVAITLTQFSNVVLRKNLSNTNEIKAKTYCTVYFNPANSQFSIRILSKINQNAEVSIFNTLGILKDLQRYSLSEGSNLFILNCSEFQSGNYIVKVKLLQETLYKKIIIDN